MGRVLAGVLVLLALTGCVQAAQPPEAGFTDEQSMARAVEFAENSLGDGALDGLTVTLVEPGNLGDAIVDCLAEAGFGNYTSMGDGVLFDGDTMSEAEGQAYTLCAALWQTNPDESGVLNADQLGYLYDFYRESLIPCLAMAGVHVTDAPTRAQFIAAGGVWQPAVQENGSPLSAAGARAGGFEVGQSPWYRSTPDSDPLARCVTWPPEWQS